MINLVLDILIIGALAILILALFLAVLRGLRASRPAHPWYQTKYSSEELPTITVVVPAYNEEKDIQQLIKNLGNLDYPNYEIIVVDDGSSDQTWDILLKSKQRVTNLKIIQHEHNKGRGAAINTGIAQASADLIAITDADVITPANWLKGGVKPFLYNSDIAAAGGMYRIKNPRHPADKYYDLVRNSEKYNWEFLNQDNPGIFTRFLSIGLPGFRYYFRTPGSNTFIRKSVLKQIGGFSTASRAEDVHLSRKLHELGMKTIFDPEIQIQVQGTENVNNYLKRRARIFTGEVKQGNPTLTGKTLSAFRLLAETFFLICLLIPLFFFIQDILGYSILDVELVYRLFFLSLIRLVIPIIKSIRVFMIASRFGLPGKRYLLLPLVLSPFELISHVVSGWSILKPGQTIGYKTPR